MTIGHVRFSLQIAVHGHPWVPCKSSLDHETAIKNAIEVAMRIPDGGVKGYYVSYKTDRGWFNGDHLDFPERLTKALESIIGADS